MRRSALRSSSGRSALKSVHRTDLPGFAGRASLHWTISFAFGKPLLTGAQGVCRRASSEAAQKTAL